MRPTVLVVIVMCGSAGHAFTQPPSSPPPQAMSQPRIGFLMAFGGNPVSATADIEQMLRSAGYRTDAEFEQNVGLEIHYRWYSQWSVGLVFNYDERRVQGYLGNFPGPFVSPNYQVKSVGLLVSRPVVLARGTRIGQLELVGGVGPAIFVVRTRDSFDESGSWIGDGTVTGWMVQLGFQTVAVRSRRHAFAHAGVQYRGVGQVDIGPFFGTAPGIVPTVPRTGVSFDAWSIRVGFGGRF